MSGSTMPSSTYVQYHGAHPHIPVASILHSRPRARLQMLKRSPSLYDPDRHPRADRPHRRPAILRVLQYDTFRLADLAVRSFFFVRLSSGQSLSCLHVPPLSINSFAVLLEQWTYLQHESSPLPLSHLASFRCGKDYPSAGVAVAPSLVFQGPSFRCGGVVAGRVSDGPDSHAGQVSRGSDFSVGRVSRGSDFSAGRGFRGLGRGFRGLGRAFRGIGRVFHGLSRVFRGLWLVAGSRATSRPQRPGGRRW